MSAAFIGGNLDAITDNQTKLISIGDQAELSGSDTGTAASDLASAIRESTNSLIVRFQAIADELTKQISEGHTQLESSDWKGQSRDAAVEIKGGLMGQVDGVMRQSTETMRLEGQAFVDRADLLVGHVEQEFKKVMSNVQTEYGALAEAAKQTRINLEAADQTIRMS